MITSVRLVNWRSHKDTALKFGRGTNLLVGIMGAGKSAVLDGISFALFGTFPALERRRVRLEDLIRYSEETATVEVGVEWDGDLYRIERKIRKGKRAASSAEIFRDGSLIDSGTTAVTSYVEHLLGVDYDLFTRAIYSEQNNIDYFLNLDPRRRKEELDRLLGLDRFEQARANIVSVINRVESNRKALAERHDPGTVAEIRASLEKYGKELAGLGERLGKLAEENEKEVAVLKKSEGEFRAVKEQKEKFEVLEKELDRVTGMMEGLKGEIEPEVTEELCEKVKADMEKLGGELQQLERTNKSLETERSRLSKESGTIEAQLKEEKERAERIGKLEDALEALLAGKTAGEFRDGLAGLESEMLKLASEKKALETETAEIRELVGKIKPGMANCPLCDSALDEKGIEHVKKEKNALMEKNAKRAKEIEARIPGLKEEAESLKTKLKKTEFALDKKETYLKERRDVGKLEAEKKRLGGDLERVEKGIALNSENMDEKRRGFEKTSIKAERYAKTVERKRKLALLAEKEKELLDKREKTKYSGKDYEGARERLEGSRLRKQRLETDRNALEKQAEMTGRMAVELGKRLEEINKTEEEAVALSKLSEELKIYRNALLDTQISLRKNLIEAINAAMNEIWEIFYPYRNYGAVRLEVTEKDYLFEVHERGEWKALETVASGGERACAALTLRVALATVLTPNLSWLILDEPTHNLDREAVALLSETLQLKVPQVVRQTFVITHEEGLIGADFATSYRLKRSKETDGPTESEGI